MVLIGKQNIFSQFLLLQVLTTTQCEEAMGQNEWCAIVDVMFTSRHIVVLIGLVPKKLFIDCTSFVAIYSSLCLLHFVLPLIGLKVAPLSFFPCIFKYRR